MRRSSSRRPRGFAGVAADRELTFLSTHRDRLDGPTLDKRVPGDPLAVVGAGGGAVRRQRARPRAPATNTESSRAATREVERDRPGPYIVERATCPSSATSGLSAGWQGSSI